MKTRSSWWIFLLSGCFTLQASATDVPVFSETLAQAENHGRDNSRDLKASQQTSQAAADQAEASEDSLFPRLTFEGSYYYQTHIPEINLGIPGVPSGLNFGTNSNYTVGPALYYTLFDGGQTRKQWKSAENLARARNEDFRATYRNLKLNLQLAYFKLQLSQKNLMLTSDSLKLSQAQEHDIRNRFRAGSASRLDAINARRDVLDNQLKFRQAQNDLAISVRDLFALTDEGQGLNASKPLPSPLLRSLPEGTESPTLVVQIDSIESVLQSIGRETFSGPDQEHPQIKSLTYSAEASKLASEAIGSGLWPKIQFTARSEMIYPDLVLPQTAQQNIFSVSLTMPLFEFGLTRSQEDQQAKEAMAHEYQKQQKIIDLTKDWNKAHDLLESLRSQEKLSAENAIEAAEAAKLTYESYKAGKRQYLDVETANLRLLEAQVSATLIQGNILNAIAQLEYLSNQ